MLIHCYKIKYDTVPKFGVKINWQKSHLLTQCKKINKKELQMAKKFDMIFFKGAVPKSMSFLDGPFINFTISQQ